MKKGQAGSLESSDCLVTIEESPTGEISIDSVVGAFFHDQIEAIVKTTLQEKHLEHVRVHIQDRGALDATIRARLLTAIERMM